MIEVGDVRLIPEPLPKAGWALVIEKFIASGHESCRVDGGPDKDPKSLAAAVKTAVRRAKAPARVALAGERVYLVRTNGERGRT